ncbi:erythromycin esterase family protein [Chryseolinea sp. T2]|uniref:erythromycin esterase family protein n=1 Tax=Chryseolinea sp. T2 TaxID=3129255 RepID=UPI003077269B
MRISILLLFASFVFAACKDDDQPPMTEETRALVESLGSELTSLPVDPNVWTDGQLEFLDEYAGKKVVGLGEATHGTSEFFQAKHRILKYLAEKHGFKVFAIEADFGESLFINEAVMKSDKSQIESLMKNKMHFWTWKTSEVRDLLYWMCDYNVGKPMNEKLQYWGIDCQFNTYHPDQVWNVLSTSDITFGTFAQSVLNEVRNASANGFKDYSQATFDAYLKNVDALTDSIHKYETRITEHSSADQYEVTLQLARVIRQVSEVTYYSRKQTQSKNYRDIYMAENTEWIFQHLSSRKIVLWAHNYHISNYPISQTLGSNLATTYQDDYAKVGFLFSTGSFTAVTQEGDQFKGLTSQTIDTDPAPASLNDVMHKTGTPAFSVSMQKLTSHGEWASEFNKGIKYFQMGAVYNNSPQDYYGTFEPGFFDRLIYFDKSTSATQLR